MVLNCKIQVKMFWYFLKNTKTMKDQHSDNVKSFKPQIYVSRSENKPLQLVQDLNTIWLFSFTLCKKKKKNKDIFFSTDKKFKTIEAWKCNAVTQISKEEGGGGMHWKKNPIQTWGHQVQKHLRF